ncbi:hypothetical protein C8J38_101864 [Rhizobium sp. PP-WC-2G-219]|nr:hypothetical protein C8J38_101864 [Rhizobium sp. PP-WC-2G-219]
MSCAFLPHREVNEDSRLSFPYGKFDLENGKSSCQLEKALIAARTVGIDLGDLKAAVQSAPAAADDDLGYLPRFS